MRREFCGETQSQFALLLLDPAKREDDEPNDKNSGDHEKLAGRDALLVRAHGVGVFEEAVFVGKQDHRADRGDPNHHVLDTGTRRKRSCPDHADAVPVSRFCLVRTCIPSIGKLPINAETAGPAARTGTVWLDRPARPPRLADGARTSGSAKIKGGSQWPSLA
jgi:hypothetical protein